MTGNRKPSRDVVNKIFGEELPQKSADEHENDVSSQAAEHDDWLRRNIPPHHE
jgi:hypothetical protein